MRALIKYEYSSLSSAFAPLRLSIDITEEEYYTISEKDLFLKYHLSEVYPDDIEYQGQVLIVYKWLLHGYSLYRNISVTR